MTKPKQKTAPRINQRGLAALARSTKLPPNVGLARCKLVMTVVLGVGIPLLSLAMSKLAGRLAAAGHYPLALFALGLMVSVLAVSLNHLAWAVGTITRSGRRTSWLLAVALDLSLVLCETVHVYAGDLDLDWVCYAVITAVAISSMCLNVFAFLMHETPVPARNNP